MRAFRLLRPLCLIVPLLLAGCNSVSIEDAVPGARDTGTYPNLNIPPRAETDQLTDEEAAARLAELQARRNSQNAQPGSTRREADRLLLLKRTHAEKTIEEIEN
jgi:hypothetical protein